MDAIPFTLGQRSRQLRGLLFLITALGGAWIVADRIVGGSFDSVIMTGLAISLAVVTITTLNNWRAGVLLFISWLLFEDLVRKYLGNGLILLFGKDALAAIIYLSFWMSERRRNTGWFRPPFLVPLVLFFSLAFIQVFNSWTPSVLYGFLGLKLYFYYVPLLYIGYFYVRTARDLDQLIVYNLALGMAIALLGIVQSIMGSQFLSPATLAPDLRVLGNLTRYSPLTHQAVLAPTSVFVSTGRFSRYTIALVILAFGAQGYLRLTRTRRAAYGLLALGIAVVAAMQSGTRGAIVYAAISVLVLSAGFSWGTPRHWKHGRLMTKAVRRALLVIALGLFLMVQFFPRVIGANWAFYSETLSPTSSASELRARSWDYPLLNLMTALHHPRWLYGDGTGTASLGMQYVARVLGQEPIGFWVENGWGTLILEMGILGPILWIAWTSSLLYFSWKAVRQLRGTVYFPLALAIFWYAFILLVPFSYNGRASYQDYIMNAYLWLWIGVLFRLPHLARNQQPSSRTVQSPELRTATAYAGGA